MRRDGVMIPALAFVLLFGLAACSSGNGHATPPKTSQPASTCLAKETGAHAAGARRGTVTLTLAALLRVSVEVGSHRASRPRCIEVHPSASVVHLDIGDRITFVANRAPTMTESHHGTLAITTSPGPTTSGLGTTHVIVTATARAPGSAELRYIDCSGTGC